MLNIEEIFQDKKANLQKLAEAGFVEKEKKYTKNYPLDNDFEMHIFIQNNKVEVKVFEQETGEEYILVHLENAQGKFVNTMREEVEKILSQISEECFEKTRNIGERSNQILTYVKEEFDIDPVYLWEKHPEFAVLRTKEKQKWIGLVMTISKEKLGLVGKGKVEAINLKAKPEEIEKMIDGKNYLPAYHMNKKHWLTIILDENISQETIKELIKNSYNLVVKKVK